MLRFKLSQSRLIVLPALLKLSFFLIIFALTSSVISVWYDNHRQIIDERLSVSKKEQELFREVYERLWDEYFKLQAAKRTVNEYALNIQGNKNVQLPKQLICMFDNFQAHHGDKLLINTFDAGRHFLTAEQKAKYKVVEIESRTNKRIKNVADGFYGYCALNKNYKTGQALEIVITRLQAVLVISRELKAILEARILEETHLLTENYKNSNIAIFIAFLLQLFVFSVVSFVDINTSTMRRVNK